MQKCAKNFGFEPDIIHLEPRHEAKFAFCNHDKAKKMLEFKDNTDLEVTINKMFEWALTQPNREVKTVEYELTKTFIRFGNKSLIKTGYVWFDKFCVLI